MCKLSSMSYHGKQMQPFQPSPSLAILLFYRHTKAKLTLQVRHQVVVSDQT